jgi:hypothetical protein
MSSFRWCQIERGVRVASGLAGSSQGGPRSYEQSAETLASARRAHWSTELGRHVTSRGADALWPELTVR